MNGLAKTRLLRSVKSKGMEIMFKVRYKSASFILKLAQVPDLIYQGPREQGVEDTLLISDFILGGQDFFLTNSLKF